MTEQRKHKRHHTEDYLMVFERESDKHIGGLANLSSEGAMFVTQEPVQTLTAFRCRVELTQPIMDHHEVIFDAECRWCRKNVKTGWWESGYALKNVTKENEELLSYLVLRFRLGEWEVPGAGEVKTVSMKNRRNHPRFVVRDFFPVRDKRTARHIGGLANLTMEGTMLTTLEPVEKGSMLHCRAELPKKIFQRDYLVFDAECAWCKKNEDKGWYESGYRLKNLSEQDSVIIMHLIIHYLEEQQTEERVCVAP